MCSNLTTADRAMTCSIFHTVAQVQHLPHLAQGQHLLHCGTSTAGTTFSCVAAGTVDRANLRVGERALDLASGTGLCALDAAQRVGPEGAVVGVDLTDTMLAVVRPSTLGAQGATPYDTPCSVALCQQRSPRLAFMLMSAADIQLHDLLSRVNTSVRCRPLAADHSRAFKDNAFTPPKQESCRRARKRSCWGCATSSLRSGMLTTWSCRRAALTPRSAPTA